jgi:hypothetical protein
MTYSILNNHLIFVLLLFTPYLPVVFLVEQAFKLKKIQVYCLVKYETNIRASFLCTVYIYIQEIYKTSTKSLDY